ncbi:MAG: hypothetical protein ACYDBQ_05595 [Thermoplasmatota archaeon]
MIPATLEAAVLCIIPAMGALFWSLRRYEGYFDERKLFFMLVVGFFAGIFVRFLEVHLFAFDAPVLVRASWSVSLVWTTVGFALAETLAKIMVLGTRKFRKKKDTPFYAPGLGLGFGAMVALQVSIMAIALQPPTLGIGAQVVSAFVLLLLATGIVLTAGAATIWIAKAAAAGKLWSGALVGTLATMPATLGLWLWGRQYDLRILPPGVIALALAAIGGLLAWRAHVVVLDQIVPQDIRDQVQRARRRETRRSRQ